MLSAFRRLFDTRRPRIAMRAKVNLIGSFGVLQRTDGVIEAVVGDEAYVEWANGSRSVENIRHLVQITG
ncbi:MAG: hypothetical protein ABI619_08065 [Betaproteobacteria bacterium]